MSALRRVLAAPGLWASLFALHLLLGLILKGPLAAMITAALDPFTIAGGERLLRPLAELLALHPPLVVAIAVTLGVAALGGGLLRLLVAGGVIRRLAGPASVAEIGGAALRFFPGILVLAIYSALLRGLLLLILLRGDPLGLGLVIRGVVLILAWTLVTAALDLARAAVVVDGAKAYAPRTLGRGFARALQRPTIWLGSGLLSLASLGLGLGLIALATQTLGAPGPALWGARLLAGVGVGLLLWRQAVGVDAIATAPPEAGKARSVATGA